MLIESLNREEITSFLTLHARKLLSGMHIFNSLDSTNTYLLSHEGCITGHVCLAEEQTQGRGRRGKTWVSPSGANIYCSLNWHFDSFQTMSGLSLAVAVMIVDALKIYGASEGIQLKWPNDIWFANRKLGGVLIENKKNMAVIGFGLNICLPESSPKEWVALQEITSAKQRRNYLVAVLLNSLFEQLPIFAEKGLAHFLPRWRELDALIGNNVLIETEQGVIEGLARGISDTGELLFLDQNQVLQRAYSGDVSVKLD